ncbi:tRNA (N6-threonylcarbamoyladenosine(37)-N6)-methyltransferase TrmO [Methanobacterium sp.]|uniref:tRNA (N6-threonylcarbamoyladenosine(37)-N6)-methyltransferase TrmO n=1 Tax=Methanobacterium sp. TaxID=2164 RepID=UPI003C771DBF
MEIELKTVEENKVASISHVGPVEEMSELISELTRWVIEKGLQITQPPFVAYYTSPMEVSPEKMEYEVGIPFKGSTDGDVKVKIKIMPKHKTISTIFKGPYSEIGPIYAEMMQHTMKRKYEIIGAPREVYLNNPCDVPENELLTEVIFPVIDLGNCENPENVNIAENPEITIEEDSYTISPIGYAKRNGMNAFLEINNKYVHGLKELDNFSHVMVLWLADKIENTGYPNILQMYPPYALDKLTGVFATRAEYRPNPIAVTTCKILDVNEEKGTITVANLDAIDGTPIIDLKPYMPSFDRVKEPKIPKWLSFLWPEWVH